jgi:hypothetical protein
MNPGKTYAVGWCIPVILFILVMVMAGSAGCIKIAQNALGGGKEGGSADTASGSSLIAPQSVSTTSSGITSTPQTTNSVLAFSPTTTPDIYVIQHATRINGTSVNYLSFLNRQPLYTNTYTMNGYPVGLLANVAQGPLYVVFTVNPVNDCLKHPEDCRGSTTVPVNQAFMTITVLDNQTHQIVAEDGYGGEYSSDTGTYSSDCTAQSSTSNTFSKEYDPDRCQQPTARYISLYRQGEFQIVMNGMYCSVTVSIITGSSPLATPTE